MKSIEKLLKKSEDTLNTAFADFNSPPSSTLAKEFYELRIQAAIFNYELQYDMAALWQTEPSGFAEKVALKGIVHKLYEYDQLMQKHLLNRLLSLARARNVDIDREEIKAERKKWKAELSRLQSWSDLRNQATGHYGKNVPKQVELLQGIDRKEVSDVTTAFLKYNLYVLGVFANAGRGSAT